MEFQTLDVRTADGHTLKVGVCANGCTGPSVLILPIKLSAFWFGMQPPLTQTRPLAHALLVPHFVSQ